MTVALLTPNWKIARVPFPTDTLRPPQSFPLEWGYISGGLSGSCVILDAYAASATLAETADLLRNLQPSSVVVSSTPSYLFWRCPPFRLDIVRAYVEMIRQAAPRTFVIIVGPHGTVDPYWTLMRTGADYVFRGEPDFHLPRALASEDVSALENCPYLFSEERAGEIAPEKDFQQTACVDYSPLGRHPYVPHAWGAEASAFLQSLTPARFALFESSRGCSFSCGFCLRAGFRNSYREKPLEQIERELEQLKALDVRYIFFIDETYGLSWEHAHRVAAAVAWRGMKYGIQTRPDLLTQERLDLLRSTGCVYIELGVEALEESLLARLGKFNHTRRVHENLKAARATISFVNANILDCTNQDCMDIDSCLPQHDNSGKGPPPFMPYPGTQFGERAISRYQGKGEFAWDVGEDLYLVYSLMSRYRWLSRMLDRNLSLRRVFRRLLRATKKLWPTFGSFYKSWFEASKRKNGFGSSGTQCQARLYGCREPRINTRE